MTRFSLLAVILAIFPWMGLPHAPLNLSGVELTVSEIADSGDYFVYRYTLTNPASSTWGLAAVTIDIGATAGANTLPTTGPFLDARGSRPGQPHAEVGPISPEGWEASLTRTAQLAWYPPSTGSSTSDSVAPGETRGGFGIRSSYLPGIQTIVAEPTVESCCLVIPASADGPYYPTRGSFAVSANAVMPRYRPDEVDISLLHEQARAVCSIPLWVDDVTLCQRLSAYLEGAGGSFVAGDVDSALEALDSFLRAVLENRAPAGGISHDAYWLLSRNAQQVSSRLSSQR